jgi:hypothetical protein
MLGDKAVVVIPTGYTDEVVEPVAERGEAVMWRSVFEPASDVFAPEVPLPYPLELTGVRRAPAVEE